MSMSLWTLTALFAVRVFGQALQHVLALPYLPAFEDFQGSRLPYGMLFTTQLLILGAMARISWRIQRGVLVPRRRLGRVLWWFGWIYLVGSAARLAIGLTMVDAHPWFRTWIPASFHLVLAAFVLLAACYHLHAEISAASAPSTT